MDMSAEANLVSPNATAIPDDPIWRLSVEQYHEMIGAGILTDDDPVELLEGWLVTKMPKNRPHSLATQLSREVLAKVIPAGWYVDAQEPITTLDSEPEPDVIVVRGQRRDYQDRHPLPSEVALVIEVSDATLQRDRTLKLRLYARAGIAAYWILNLPDEQLELYAEPLTGEQAAAYQRKTIYQPSDSIPIFLDGQEVARITVRDLLP